MSSQRVRQGLAITALAESRKDPDAPLDRLSLRFASEVIARAAEGDIQPACDLVALGESFDRKRKGPPDEAA